MYTRGLLSFGLSSSPSLKTCALPLLLLGCVATTCDGFIVLTRQIVSNRVIENLR